MGKNFIGIFIFSFSMIVISGSLLAEKSTEELIKDLDSSDPNTQISAAQKLGEEKEEKGTSGLIKMMESTTNIDVARQAAIALGQIGKGGTATDALLKAIKNMEPEMDIVRYSGLAALFQINEKTRKDEIIGTCNWAVENTQDPLLKDLANRVAEFYSK